MSRNISVVLSFVATLYFSSCGCEKWKATHNLIDPQLGDPIELFPDRSLVESNPSFQKYYVAIYHMNGCTNDFGRMYFLTVENGKVTAIWNDNVIH